MRRFVLLSLAGILVVFLAALAFIEWSAPPEAPPPEPRPSPAVETQRRPAILAPPPAAVTSEVVESFVNPPPKAVPEPPSPAPAFDLSGRQADLQAVVARQCGGMTVRLGDEMRRQGDTVKGEAILLVDAEPMAGRVKLGQSRQQSPGNLRPSLVACAQMALRGKELPVAAARPGERFTVQVVLGMDPAGAPR